MRFLICPSPVHSLYLVWYLPSVELCNEVSLFKVNVFPPTLFFPGFYDSQLTKASLMEMQIYYLSKTENAFQNSGWWGRKYISISTCGLSEGEGAGRSHFPGICGIKVFVWCWDINKTAVVRAPVHAGQFGNFKLLYSSGFSPCIIRIQITPYCYYEVFDLGTRKFGGLDISSCFPEEVPWCEAVLGPYTSEASFLPLLLILFFVII